MSEPHYHLRRSGNGDKKESDNPITTKGGIVMGGEECERAPLSFEAIR